jgi:hypothetical protein
MEVEGLGAAIKAGPAAAFVCAVGCCAAKPDFTKAGSAGADARTDAGVSCLGPDAAFAGARLTTALRGAEAAGLGAAVTVAGIVNSASFRAELEFARLVTSSAHWGVADSIFHTHS